MNTSSWNIAEVEKSLLHVHLEGSVSLETLRSIAERKGLAGPKDDLYSFTGFEQFNALFPEVFRIITEEEDFYQLTKNFTRELHRENVVYCEAFCVPLAHVRRGIPLEKFLPPILTALDEAERDYGLRVSLLYSIVRWLGQREWGEQTLDLYEQRPDERIVGIDLCGPESLETIAPFAEVFDRARSLGLHCTAHAGEFGSAEQVQKTLEILKPERIGHGIAAVNDPRVMEELVHRDVPLEISLSSNIRLEAVAEMERHPVRTLFEHGVPLLICTDDPAFFDCTLCGEYELLRARFGFTREELETLVRNSFRYRFG